MKKQFAFLRLSAIAAFILSIGVSGNLFGQCSVPGVPSSITGSSNACPGQTKQYTVSTVSGATSYTWTLPAGCNISGQNPYTSASTTVNIVFSGTFNPPGTISVKANNACGSSADRNKSVSAYYPSLNNIQGPSPSTACNGDVINYYVASDPEVLTYTWTSPAGSSVTSGQGTSSVNITYNASFTSGNVTVAGSYGCGNGSAKTRYIVKGNTPSAPIEIYGSDEACAGTTKTFSVDPVSGMSFIWTGPTGSSITGQGTSTVQITFPSGFAGGYVQCKSSNNCGTSANTSKQVRSTPLTPLAISGFASGICNTTANYSIAPVFGATSYTWTPPAGATVISGQGTTNATISFPSSVSGFVSVKAVNSCGASPDKKLAVTGNIIIATHPQSKSVCEDDTTTLTVDVPGGGLSYQWRKNGVQLTDNADYSGTQTSVLSILKVDSLNAGSYDVVVSSTCAPSVTSSSANFGVNMKPPVPSEIDAPIYACPGNTNVMISVLPNGYNTTGNYWWVNSDAAITSGQGTNQITVDFFPTNNSTYSVRCWGVNACGLSKDTSKVKLRYSVSTPHITGGPLKVCQGQTNVTYIGDPVNGATGYNWQVSPGMTITGGQGTLNLTVDFSPTFTSGQVCLQASDPCFTSPFNCKTITFDVPATPGNISGQAYSACNATYNYSISPVQGANSYSWSLPPGASIMNGAGTNSVDIYFSSSFNDADICVAGTGNCVTGPSRCYRVFNNPDKPASINCNSPVICAYQSNVQFDCSPSFGATNYLWTVPQGSTIISGQGTTSITVNFGNKTGQVGVRSQNACGNSGTKTFAVNFSCRTASENSIINGTVVDVFPNPAKNKITVTYQTEISGETVFTLNDILGKQVLYESGIAEAGINQSTLDLKGILKGLYFLTVKTGDSVRQVRLVID